MIVTYYFDEKLLKIRRTVYGLIEQNHSSGEKSFAALLEKDEIALKSILGFISYNAGDMVGQ